MTPKEAVELGKKHNVQYVDLKFIDFPGVWQHTTIPAWRLTEELFEEGIGFDGSSIRGWQPINASDMLTLLIKCGRNRHSKLCRSSNLSNRIDHREF